MSKSEAEDDLRSEYDVHRLQVRKLGPGRKTFLNTVRLDPDVVTVFPDADAVNNALRSLMETAKRSENPHTADG